MRISPEYLAEQRKLHADPRGYGQRGAKWADQVQTIALRMGKMDAILDYGCGANTLAAELSSRGLRTRSYDPAIPAFDHEPPPTDLVVCTDVLEHVEPACILPVLSHLAQLTKRQLFVVISLVETDKKLSDGRSAHVLVKPAEWWRQSLHLAGFQIVQVFNIKPEKQLAALFERAK